MFRFSTKPSETISFPQAEKPASLRAEQERPSVALYAASALVQVSGLAAVCFQVSEPGFTVFTIGLTLVGTVTSYLLRRLGARSDLLKWGAVALALVFICAVRRIALLDLLVPAEGTFTQEVVLVCALALTATFGSFLLVTDDALIFTCIWTIAMIGLTGTVNVNSELPICFVVFLLSAAFLLVHQNALRIRRSATTTSASSTLEASTSPLVSSAPVRNSDRWRLLRAEFTVALAAWGIALILGTLVAIPVQMVGRNMSLNAILRQLRAPLGANAHPGPMHLVFNNVHDFAVGLGPVDGDPSSHFTVLSEKPHYWRGRTYDYYTGHGWTSQENIDRHAVKPINDQPDANGLYTFVLQSVSPAAKLPLESSKITTDFHALGGSAPPFYCAAEPIVLRAPIQEIGEHPDRTVGAQELHGSDYEVVSAFYAPRASELRRSGSHYPPAITGHYLETSQIADSVQALAQEAVIGVGANPYDRASTIKRFIGARCTYNQSARAVPRDRDAVDFFLNESREGYCDLYASAMVTMCRSVGIPARVATGYAPGTPITDSGGDDLPHKAAGDNRQHYLLRGDDLHAWAEVYFVNYGWIVFDPTADTLGGVSGLPLPAAAEKSKTTPWRRFAGIALSLGLLAAILAIANEIRLRVRFASFSGPFRSRSARTVTHAYRTAARILARRGARRTTTMTAGEYVALVKSRFGQEAAQALQALTVLEERLLYADPAARIDTVDATIEVEQVRVALRDLRRALKNRSVNITEGVA